MENNFHSNLTRYFNNNEMATGLVLQELAKALVHDRENFIEVLKNANVVVLEGSSDAQLIDSFVKNAPGNKQLLLGAALLVNHRNKTTNFDGEEELSDRGVKQSFYALDEFFNASGEDHSNAGWSDAIKSIADVGGQVSGKVMDAQAQKKRGASTMLAQQQQARRDLTQSVLAQRQKQQEDALKEKAKTKRTMLIVGGVGVALLIGIGIYFVVKNKKK